MIDYTTPYGNILKSQFQKPVEEVICIRTGVLEPVFDSYVRFYNPHIAVRYINVHAYLSSPERINKIIVILSLRELAPILWEQFYILTSDARKTHINNVKLLLLQLISKLETHSSHVVFFSLHEELLVNSTGNTYTISDLIEELNNYIREIIHSTKLVSIQGICERSTLETIYDRRMLYAFGCPYSRVGCNVLAYYAVKSLHEVEGKKCIVCDCDGVLWGGVLLDDGYDGIVLSGDNYGRAYRDFQRELTRLIGEGIIICLCSKNVESSVREVLQKHPDMILREEHIVSMKINYRNKSDSIRELAEELNISVADMVFIDDSDYEIGLVRAVFPEITCVKLDAERPYTYTSVIRELPCFSPGYITDEDRTRTKKYREELERHFNFEDTIDVSAYHASLNVKIDIHVASSFDLSRTFQLAQRTNQCNLSDCHPSFMSFKEWSVDPSYRILCLYVSDIYGDMGQIGAAVLCVRDATAIVEHFWVSCRAFGRGFEEILLKELQKVAVDAGCETIVGKYNATKKNKRFADFYSKNGIAQL